MDIYKLSKISNEIISRCKELNIDYYDFVFAIVLKRFDDLLDTIEETNIDNLNNSIQVNFKELLAIDEQITHSFFKNRLNNQYNFYRIIHEGIFYYSSNIKAFAHQLAMFKFSSNDNDNKGILSDSFYNQQNREFYNHNDNFYFYDSLIRRFRDLQHLFYEISFKEFTSLEFVYLLMDLINSGVYKIKHHNRKEIFPILLSYFLIEKNNPTNQEINQVYQISQINVGYSLFEKVTDIYENCILDVSDFQIGFNVNELGTESEYMYLNTRSYLFSIFSDIGNKAEKDLKEKRYFAIAMESIVMAFHEGLKDKDPYLFPNIGENIYEKIKNNDYYCPEEILSFYLSVPLIYIVNIKRNNPEEFNKLIEQVISSLLNNINRYFNEISDFFTNRYSKDKAFKKQFCEKFGYEYPVKKRNKNSYSLYDPVEEFEEFEKFVFEIFSR